MKGAAMEADIEELKARTRRWTSIMEFVREETSPEIAASMEQKHRLRLKRRMALFQQELNKLPDIQRMRLSMMLSEKLITALSDLHIAAVTINEHSRAALYEVMELYGI
jgi:macrodomain Ter protein organizer (MatP/YcbG family)